MAVPTVTAVTPSVGHSGGGTLIQITGTNFKLPPDPIAEGITTPPGPSVRVRLAGVDATQVEVWSATSLYCLTPKSVAYSGDLPAVDVEVQNLDTNGDPIVGEVATLADAFTHQRPNFAEQSDLARVLRAMIREIRRQILDNVHVATHTDYDPDTGDLLNLVPVGKLPAITLLNLEYPLDPEYAVNHDTDVEADTGRFLEKRPPTAIMVKFDLVAASDDTIEIANIANVTHLFFRKNPTLTVDRYDGDPSLGQVSFPLEWSFAGPVAVAQAGSNSNVASFGGQVRIRGVLLQDMPGVSTAKIPGIPAHFPHEATTRYGHVSADDSTAVEIEIQPKTLDD